MSTILSNTTSDDCRFWYTCPFSDACRFASVQRPSDTLIKKACLLTAYSEPTDLFLPSRLKTCIDFYATPTPISTAPHTPS